MNTENKKEEPKKGDEPITHFLCAKTNQIDHLDIRVGNIEQEMKRFTKTQIARDKKIMEAFETTTETTEKLRTDLENRQLVNKLKKEEWKMLAKLDKTEKEALKTKINSIEDGLDKSSETSLILIRDLRKDLSELNNRLIIGVIVLIIVMILKDIIGAP
jgi:hypothetical protein